MGNELDPIRTVIKRGVLLEPKVNAKGLVKDRYGNIKNEDKNSLIKENE